MNSNDKVDVYTTAQGAPTALFRSGMTLADVTTTVLENERKLAAGEEVPAPFGDGTTVLVRDTHGAWWVCVEGGVWEPSR